MAKSQTYRQQAYTAINTQILDLSFKPGQELNDVQIARDQGIGRTPVREALRKLESESLVVSQYRHGWRVSALSMEDIHEIFDLKEALEAPLEKEAADCRNRALRKRLREAMRTMKQASRSDDSETWREADKAIRSTLHQT